MNKNINVKLLKEKIKNNKEIKKEELIKKLEMSVDKIKSRDGLEDSEIQNIIQSLLDYKKSCVSYKTIDAISNENEEERIESILELI